MAGLTALVGAGEYLSTMDEIDQRLLAEAGNRPPRVACIPAAAGQEGEASVDRWAEMGVTHFRRLGAEAECARITDLASADDPRWAALIEAADLIYFSGGDPLYRVEFKNASGRAVRKQGLRDDIETLGASSTAASPEPDVVTSMKFIAGLPMNPATKRLFGRS